MFNIKRNSGLTILTVACLSLLFGCKKFLDLPLPTDKLAADGAYISDAAASAVISGILLNAATNGVYGSNNTFDAISYRTSLYADDLLLLNPGGSNFVYTGSLTFYTDNAIPANLPQWSALYKQIYLCNLAIEGVTANQSSLSHKDQWLGEAHFLRALSYFDLVQLYGDVPLSTSSSYQVNSKLGRSPQADIYTLMVADLKNAETLLKATYVDYKSDSTGDRIRPNQFAAAALLARIYLYMGDWANTETEATKVIGNTSLYKLETPSSVFLAGSKETLFALVPYTSNSSNGAATYVRNYGLYNAGVPATVPDVATLGNTYYSLTPISNTLRNAFEAGDTRFSNWLKPVSTTTPASLFYFPNKYKSNVAGVESNVILRLAEQYLIRAEARARQNNPGGARDDINMVRARASLGNTPAATQPDLLAAIMKERRVELFTECGHRFYDLKRTGTIDLVMTAAAIEKSNNSYTNTPVTWSSFKQYWPIPLADIQANPALKQTPGYN